MGDPGDVHMPGQGTTSTGGLSAFGPAICRYGRVFLLVTIGSNAS
jgi:hypothetical protein